MIFPTFRGEEILSSRIAITVRMTPSMAIFEALLFYGVSLAVLHSYLIRMFIILSSIIIHIQNFIIRLIIDNRFSNSTVDNNENVIRLNKNTNITLTQHKKGKQKAR